MFLSTPSPSEASSALYARDLADDGYVSNLTRRGRGGRMYSMRS